MQARAAAFCLVLFLPGLAGAQTVLTFDHLADRLNAGDRVRIVDVAGRVHVGEVAGLTAGELALARDGGATERFARADVHEVWMRRHDPVSNGALIGFAGVAAGYCGLAISWGNTQQCGVPALFLGGLGAGVGAIVDAAITRRVAIFRAGAPVSLERRPERGGVGAGVTWRW